MCLIDFIHSRTDIKRQRCPGEVAVYTDARRCHATKDKDLPSVTMSYTSLSMTHEENFHHPSIYQFFLIHIKFTLPLLPVFFTHRSRHISPSKSTLLYLSTLVPH